MQVMSLPYEYRLVQSKKDEDSITLINANFGFNLTEEKLEKTVSKISKEEEHFYTTSNNVGFTVFKSKRSFNTSLFALDLDGTADGINESLKVPCGYCLILKNHPTAFLQFSSGKEEVEVEVLKAKDESCLSSFEVAPFIEYLCEKINSIHFEEVAMQKYSDEFYEKSILKLENFFRGPFGFENFETWSRAGPADYRSFKYNLKADEINALMKSKEFMTWLSFITGLPLIHPATPIYTRCLQAAGDYQILHGNYSEPFGLDVIYSCYPTSSKPEFKEWSESSCGRIHYLNDSGDEIYQIDPVNNSLTIVYRTEGCSRFTENVKGVPEIPLFQTIAIYSIAEDQ